MVARVSPSCTRTAANTERSSSHSRLAMALAIAVTDAVSSHGFMLGHPLFIDREPLIIICISTGAGHISLNLRFFEMI